MTVDTQEIGQFVMDEACAILDRRSVSLSEDFFELGGDSLDAVDLVGRIESRFWRVPALSGIFSMRSLEEIADAVRAAQP